MAGNDNAYATTVTIGASGGVATLTSSGPNSTGFVIRSNILTRPADTLIYASGDLVSSSTTGASCAPLTFTGLTTTANYGSIVRIDRVRLRTSSTSVTAAQFRAHFYAATAAASNGDNGVWLTPITDYIGAADITVDRQFTNGAEGCGVPLIGPMIMCNIAAGADLFCYLEARAAYTPTSAGTFTVILEGQRI